MGDFELVINLTTTALLGLIIYNIINIFLTRNLISRFGFNNRSSRDYYECGLSPLNQITPQIPLQFIMVTVFFVIYDIELTFLFPLVSGLTAFTLWDVALFLFFFLILYFNLWLDYTNNALNWQY